MEAYESVKIGHDFLRAAKSNEAIFDMDIPFDSEEFHPALRKCIWREDTGFNSDSPFKSPATPDDFQKKIGHATNITMRRVLNELNDNTQYLDKFQMEWTLQSGMYFAELRIQQCTNEFS